MTPHLETEHNIKGLTQNFSKKAVSGAVFQPGGQLITVPWGKFETLGGRLPRARQQVVVGIGPSGGKGMKIGCIIVRNAEELLVLKPVRPLREQAPSNPFTATLARKSADVALERMLSAVE